MKNTPNGYEEVNYDNFNSVYEILNSCFEKYANYSAITDEYSAVNLTYAEMKEQIDLFATGLQTLGVKKGDCISLFSESNGRWPIIDLGILKCGAIDAVRGSNAPIDELSYILKHSESKFAIFQTPKLFEDMKSHIKDLDLTGVVLMFGDVPKDIEDTAYKVYTYENILETGRKHTFNPVETTKEDVFTILYTSGTTGLPKGVMLQNKGFVHQLKHVHTALQCNPGEISLEILPVWHAFERMACYYVLSRGCHICHTTLGGFRNDMIKYDTGIMMSVPRIWEAIRTGIYNKAKQISPLFGKIFSTAIKISIIYKAHKMYGERRITNKWSYNTVSTVKHKLLRSFLKPLHILFTNTVYKKIKNETGTNFRVVVSGGGALSMRDELFYDAIGINLRVGYGLSETSPVIAIRHVGDKNFLGSVGKPLGEMEIKTVDPKTRKETGIFKQGLVMTRGPQIMKGYLKDPEATNAVIDKEGWFNTGDLGWMTKDNNLVLVGRLKETIVLSNGENVEPIPIEEACLLSPYIEQIVLVGQDKSGIGALVVPSKEALEKCGIKMKDAADYKDSLINNPELQELIRKEINENITKKAQLKPFEKIKQFLILKKGFSVENGLLSATQKIKRNKIFDKYQNQIEKMYDK